MKESFTDGHLITLSLSDDREAIADVCGLLAERADGLLETRFINGVKRIGQGISPDGAFDWRHKQLRQEIKKEAMVLFKTLSIVDFYNDQDLFNFAITVLKKLRTGRCPNESFGWNQSRRGRRKDNSHALRDYEIRMTVHELMRVYGLSFLVACELIDRAIPSKEDQSDTIIKIAGGINGNVAPKCSENIFPINKDNSLKIDESLLKKELSIIIS